MLEDKELVEAAIQGSVEAFTQLAQRHQGRVRAYLGQFQRDPIIVDDLAQEVFLAAFRSLHDFQTDRPFIPWIFGIARHRALTELRSEARRRSKEARHLASAVAAWRVEYFEADVENPLESEQAVLALRKCIARLPNDSRRLVAQVYERSRGIAEVAREMGRNAGSMRVTLLRIRLALRRCIERRMAPERA
jgi:RNA polymerase sigma-70 factor (ECF subfamily)